MAYRYLPADLPARLRATGLEVVVLPGWEDRGRPASTGSFDPVGVLWHHTGGSSDTRAYAEWMTYEGRSDLPAPLCQLSISRAGVVYVCAAGRSNHAGKAKASGSVAAGDGNALYVGVECMNTGSEGWSPAQYGAMVATGAVLADLLGTSVEAQRAHRETSVTGKWDPGQLDMDRFRADIAARITADQEDEMNKDQERKLDEVLDTVRIIERMNRRKLERVNTRLARANGYLREQQVDLDAVRAEIAAALAEGEDGDASPRP